MEVETVYGLRCAAHGGRLMLMAGEMPPARQESFRATKAGSVLVPDEPEAGNQLVP